jgi:ribonuclease P protein component
MITLKRVKDITKVFEQGTKKAIVDNVIIKVVTDGKPGYVFAVSTKNFKRAVDRNRIKRLMREEVKNTTPTMSVALIYVGKEVPKSLNFQKKLVEVLSEKDF